jgi:hypothetical protein
MNNNKTSDFTALLKGLSTERLEGLLPVLLKELRTRDSNQIRGDAIKMSRTLRGIRSTDRLP